MKIDLSGIHHVTAIAGDPQQNLNFYAGILGLRLVKKTVNFDDPYTYHFYFGDATGTPGTLLTFFPWSSRGHRGVKGTGQISTFSFSVPPTSLGYWRERLQREGIVVSTPSMQMGEQVLAAIDHDGFQFNLVAAGDDRREGWSGGEVPPDCAIRGIHSIALSEQERASTEEFLLNLLGFTHAGAEGNRVRYRAGNDASFIDLILQPETARGTMGAGIIHHVAFRTPTGAAQGSIRDHLAANHVEVTPIIDRTYFHSIYFHEPGGALFEVATDPPGFLTDETVEGLGLNLKLPPQYEPYRADIEQVLPPVSVPVLQTVRR